MTRLSHFGPLQGVYSPPPKKKTRFWEGFTFPDHAVTDFRKESAEIPPRRMVRGVPHFSSKTGDNMVWGGETFLKNWSKRGYPILGTFWHFWGFPVKTVCLTGLPEDASQQRKRYTTLRGSSQRPSRGCISHSLRVQGPNTPSGGPLG